MATTKKKTVKRLVVKDLEKIKAGKLMDITTEVTGVNEDTWVKVKISGKATGPGTL
jgi:hypothetical protein